MSSFTKSSVPARARGAVRIATAAGVLAGLGLAAVPATSAQAMTTDSVVVSARSTLADGKGAHLVLRVNGQVASQTTVNSTSWMSVRMAVPYGTDVRTSKVELAFDNDAWNPNTGVDRNAYVRSVSGGGVTLTPSMSVRDDGLGADAFDGVALSGTDGTLSSNGALRWGADVSPVTLHGYADSTGFGFEQVNPAKGTRMRISFLRGGVWQSTTFSTDNWWSGSQSGWSSAYAELLSANGTVLAKTASISPTTATSHAYAPTRLSRAAIEGTSTSTTTTPAPAPTTALTAKDRIWKSDSFVYKKMAANAPIASNSSTVMKAVIQSGINAYGDKNRQYPSMTLNNYDYSNTIWTSHNSDPAYDIQFYDCQNKGWTDPNWVSQMKGVHIPNNAVPSPGTDGQMSIWNADTKSLTEMWVTSKRPDGKWQACWGGTIANTTTKDPQFANPYGVSGSGLAMNGVTVTEKDLKRGIIDHPVAFALPVDVVNNLVVGKATRTDGDRAPGANLAEGQYLRLPANLDIESLGLNKMQKMMAYAARDYGFVLVDRSGSWSFSMENVASIPDGQNLYNQMFEGLESYNVMWGPWGSTTQHFPFEKLQVVQAGYVPSGA